MYHSHICKVSPIFPLKYASQGTQQWHVLHTPGAASLKTGSKSQPPHLWPGGRWRSGAHSKDGAPEWVLQAEPAKHSPQRPPARTLPVGPDPPALCGAPTQSPAASSWTVSGHALRAIRHPRAKNVKAEGKRGARRNTAEGAEAPHSTRLPRALAALRPGRLLGPGGCGRGDAESFHTTLPTLKHVNI